MDHVVRSGGDAPRAYKRADPSVLGWQTFDPHTPKITACRSVKQAPFYDSHVYPLLYCTECPKDITASRAVKQILT